MHIHFLKVFSRFKPGYAYPCTPREDRINFPLMTGSHPDKGIPYSQKNTAHDQNSKVTAHV